jgi:hypothetical protein
MDRNRINPAEYASERIKFFAAARTRAEPAMWQAGVDLLETYLNISVTLGEVPTETGRDLRQKISELQAA